MKIKCLICGDIIDSKYRHNLVSCKCENCYIDGGNDYCHFEGKDFNKILLILMIVQKLLQVKIILAIKYKSDEHIRILIKNM